MDLSNDIIKKVNEYNGLIQLIINLSILFIGFLIGFFTKVAKIIIDSWKKLLIINIKKNLVSIYDKYNSTTNPDDVKIKLEYELYNPSDNKIIITNIEYLFLNRNNVYHEDSNCNTIEIESKNVFNLNEEFRINIKKNEWIKKSRIILKYYKLNLFGKKKKKELLLGYFKY